MRSGGSDGVMGLGVLRSLIKPADAVSLCIWQLQLAQVIILFAKALRPLLAFRELCWGVCKHIAKALGGGVDNRSAALSEDAYLC